MDVEKRIVTRPGHRIPFGSDGHSVQCLDQANLDTKVIVGGFGKVPGSDMEALTVVPMSHHTNANGMQHNSKWIATQTEIFEQGDSTRANELLSVASSSVLDCLNCKKFPEASPWDWMEIEDFIQVAKHAIVCIANAYHADAERLIQSVDSPGNMYWVQLFRKIDSAKPAKVRLTKKDARTLFDVEETTFRKMLKAGKYGLENTPNTPYARHVLVDKSEYDRRKSEK